MKRPERASYGRRAGDNDTRATVTAKAIAGIVLIVNAIILVGEAVLTGSENCL